MKDSTTNPCRLCAPMGAVIAFKGFEGMMPILHGSQGCATYIRRYLISHFREPVDVASSSFTEETAIFGGKAQLLAALDNVEKRYAPKAVGIASTCLSETIGDDVRLFIRELEATGLPLVTVSTPSYRGSHPEGFKAALAAVLRRFLGRKTLAADASSVLIASGMVSPADLRILRESVSAFGLKPVIAPDYADTLDGGSWESYHALSPGGTPMEELEALGSGSSWIALSAGGSENEPVKALREKLGSSGSVLPYPLGIDACDEFITRLRDLADRPVPEEIEAERARLLDSYADFHKYLAGLRIAVIADADLACGLTRFIGEVGAKPVFAALPDSHKPLLDASSRAGFPVYGGVDFEQVEELVKERPADLILASSKAYPAARRMGLPLVRIGFPVHDRVGGARIAHLGYRGTHQLLDRIVNTILERRQAESPVGYAYQ